MVCVMCMLTGGGTHINRGQTTHEQLQLAAGEDGNEIGRHQLMEALLEGIDLLIYIYIYIYMYVYISYNASRTFRVSVAPAP